MRLEERRLDGLKWVRWARWRVAAIGTIAVLLVGFTALAQVPPDEMRVHFIDVGQGAATLFEFPCGAILVDTGGESNGDFNSTDALKDYLAGFFARRTDLKNRLDSLILTHPHIDHTRGVKDVLQLYHPKNIVTNGQSNGSGKSGQIAAHQYAATSEGTSDPVGFDAVTVKSIETTTGLTDQVIDPIRCEAVDPTIRVLWGQSTTKPDDWTAKAFSDNNNHSVVVRIDFGKASFLITGDLEEAAISNLLARYKGTDTLDVDVYEVGHHGSYNGTTKPYVAAMSPKIAVMEMGPSTREDSWTAWAYGHPRKQAIDILVAGLSGSREPVTVPVATAVHKFTQTKISKAIYGTGWDGTVVFLAKTDGTLSVVGTEAVSGNAGAVNINTAAAADLAGLPSIGPKRAAAIVRYRDAHGPFVSVASLADVPGIGPATVAILRDLATVGQ